MSRHTSTESRQHPPDLLFEDNAVGRLKKEIWEASDAQIDRGRTPWKDFFRRRQSLEAAMEAVQRL